MNVADASASLWEPVVAARPRWRDQQRLAFAVTALFGVVGVAALLRAAALANRLVVLDEPARDGFGTRAADADTLVTVIGVVIGIVVLGLAPSFIVWVWRAAKNQQALARTPERLGSGWAIGGWFVPLANFVIPVLVVQDLWRGSDASIAAGDPRWRIANRSWLVGWWWGLLMLPLFLGSGEGANGSTSTLAEIRGRNLLALVSMLAACAAAVLGALVVRRLGARQETCRISLELPEDQLTSA